MKQTDDGRRRDEVVVVIRDTGKAEKTEKYFLLKNKKK